ncbi:hypothetical protein ACFW5D_37685 [Streptomyces sp. NPDC058770]|uniref:hypothetical protein n=1 Tax=Streptomyces sp. NPDC058770 TaxID=3346631 RepID=UPI00369E0881
MNKHAKVKPESKVPMMPTGLLIVAVSFASHAAMARDAGDGPSSELEAFTAAFLLPVEIVDHPQHRERRAGCPNGRIVCPSATRSGATKISGCTQ